MLAKQKEGTMSINCIHHACRYAYECTYEGPFAIEIYKIYGLRQRNALEFLITKNSEGRSYRECFDLIDKKYAEGYAPPNYPVPAPFGLMPDSIKPILKGYSNAYILNTIYENGWLEEA